jgi:hypothetical protein
MKTCSACGMPMKQPSDFAMGDIEKEYCKYCARADGSMQSYAEKLDSLTAFLIRTQGMDKKAASIIARNMLWKLPVWRDEVSKTKKGMR